VEKLQEVVSNEDINHIKQRVSVLKASVLNQIKQLKQETLDKFIEEGGNKEEFEYVPHEWEAQFNAALKTYKDNKARFLENLELEKHKNLEAKQQIIQGLKELVETESNLKILNDRFKEFQEKWREIGPVPQNESSNLWQHYHFYVEKFFDILRINKELRSLDLRKNLEQKVKLCGQTEELLL
jgi:predicted nucleic-acid-binding protein